MTRAFQYCAILVMVQWLNQGLLGPDDPWCKLYALIVILVCAVQSYRIFSGAAK